MRKIIVSAAAGLILAGGFAVPAMASSHDGAYFSGNIGVTLPRDSTFTAPITPTQQPDTMEADLDYGLAADAALGYKFGYFRLEGAIGYQGDLTEDSGGVSTSFKDAPNSANVRVISYMVNAFFDLENKSDFTPYATAGLGAATVKISTDAWSKTPLGTGTKSAWSDSDSVFAYQFGGGVEYALRDNIAIDARYRYFATSDPSFTNASMTVEAEYETHLITLGVRISF